MAEQMLDAPVTVVGAGIAGLSCARALAVACVGVRVLDRGRRPGGRMSSRTKHGRPVDLGASYLTAGADSPFAGVVGDWVTRGLARPWTDTFAVAGGRTASGGAPPARCATERPPASAASSRTSRPG